jgi:hypothetical protein
MFPTLILFFLISTAQSPSSHSMGLQYIETLTEELKGFVKKSSPELLYNTVLHEACRTSVRWLTRISFELANLGYKSKELVLLGPTDLDSVQYKLNLIDAEYVYDYLNINYQMFDKLDKDKFTNYAICFNEYKIETELSVYVVFSGALKCNDEGLITKKAIACHADTEGFYIQDYKLLYLFPRNKACVNIKIHENTNLTKFGSECDEFCRESVYVDRILNIIVQDSVGDAKEGECCCSFKNITE